LLLPLLLPGLLFAQHADSAGHKLHKCYYIGSFDFGAAFGQIDRLDQNGSSTRSGGLDAGLSFKVLRDHNFLKARASTYILPLDIQSQTPHFDSYDLIAGRQFFIGKLSSFSLASGLSYVNNYYRGYPTGTVNTGVSFLNYTEYASVRASGIGLPIELQYSFIETDAIGSTLTYAVNLNNKEIVSSLTIGVIIGKLRERGAKR